MWVHSDPARRHAASLAFNQVDTFFCIRSSVIFWSYSCNYSGFFPLPSFPWLIAYSYSWLHQLMAVVIRGIVKDLAKFCYFCIYSKGSGRKGLKTISEVVWGIFQIVNKFVITLLVPDLPTLQGGERTRRKFYPRACRPRCALFGMSSTQNNNNSNRIKDR